MDEVQRYSGKFEVWGANLVVRWSVTHRIDKHGAHVLHQPVIVGLLMPRAGGEPIHYIPWGTRARRIALAMIAP